MSIEEEKEEIQNSLETRMISLNMEKIPMKKNQNFKKVIKGEASTLNLYNIELTLDQVIFLSDIIKGSTTLTNLRIAKAGIGHEKMKYLADALKQNKALTKLDLSCNNINSLGMEYLADALKENDTLSELQVMNNNIPDLGVEELSETLKVNRSLTILNLRDNKIGPEGAKKLATGLEKNQSLDILYIARNKLGDDGIEALTKSLKGNHVLTFLDLYSNNITDKGGEAIGKFLNENDSVTTVNLAHNFIGSRGAKAIAKGLEGNNSLAHLYLDDNNIQNVGVNAIAKALEKNISLNSLRLSKNSITDAGAKCIAKGLEGNNSLSSLSLNENFITDVGANAIAKGLKGNNSLNSLSLNKNNIDARGAEKLINSLEKSLVTFLNITGTTIAKGITEKMYKSFNENTLLLNETRHLSKLIAEGYDRINRNEEKIILLMGNVGVGKTTLTHLLGNNRMQAIRDNQTEEFLIKSIQQTPEIAIGHKMASETVIPNRYITEKENTVIWDFSGFNDTDAFQELANTSYIKKLLEMTNKVKLLLVLEESEIATKKGNEFIKTIQHFTNMFSNSINLEGAVSLLINKVSSGKKLKHIKNSIKKILDSNKRVTEDIKVFVNKLLKNNINIYYKPTDEGELENNTLLKTFENTTYYTSLSEEIINSEISSKAEGYAQILLSQASNIFNKTMIRISIALKNPKISIDANNQNNSFKKYHEQIKLCLPERKILDSDYIRVDLPKRDDYFTNLQYLKALKQDLAIHHIVQLPDGILLIKSLLAQVSNFTEGDKHKTEELKKQISEYSYVLSQQYEYIKFLAKICEKELPNVDYVKGLLESIQIKVEDTLREEIESIELNKEIRDTAYYHKAIEYLDEYQESLQYNNVKAECYMQLGEISKSNNDLKQSINYYHKAIEYNKILPEAYKALGDLYYDLHEYQHAIISYKIIKDVLHIKECYKSWLGETGEDYEKAKIYMEQGDYRSSLALYEGARKSYLSASGLVQEEKLKKEAWEKANKSLSDIIGMAKSQQEQSHIVGFYDFDSVGDGFFNSLLGNDNTEVDQL